MSEQLEPDTTTASVGSRTPKQRILDCATQLGITMESQFVPWSKSRNAKEKDPSLNWKVTIRRNGREILTTDYSAGCGHCPAHKAPGLGGPNCVDRRNAIRKECESGVPHCTSDKIRLKDDHGRMQLFPDPADVLYSLAMDSDVLDSPTYEDWAGNYGYDPDSRKGEVIYRACLEIALKLRAFLGEAGLAKLREACAEY